MLKECDGGFVQHDVLAGGGELVCLLAGVRALLHDPVHVSACEGQQ